MNIPPEATRLLREMCAVIEEMQVDLVNGNRITESRLDDLINYYDQFTSALLRSPSSTPGVTCGHCGKRSTFEHIKQCRGETERHERNQILQAQENLAKLLQEMDDD